MPDEKPPRRDPAAAASIALAVLAVATFHAATLPLDSPDRLLAFAAGCALVAGAVNALARLGARHDWLGTAPGRRWTFVAGAAFLGLAAEVAIRTASNAGIPPEQVPLIAFRNVVLLLSPWTHHAAARRLGGLLATFLVVFSSALADAAWTQWLVIAFAGVGAWWLLATATGPHQRAVVRGDQRRPRRGWVTALPAGVVVVLAVVPVTGRRIGALEGFMPTSGGQDRGSPSATSGVGDGDALVAGLDDIRSFAPIDDAPFMTSHEPSLYDLFDDTYAEPRPVRQSDRAISLPPQTARTPERHDAATARKAAREFSLARKPPRRDRGRIHDTQSRALFHLQGRVPLHLRQETFDRFDGIAWHPEPATPPDELVPRLSIESVAGRPWLRTESIVCREAYAAPEMHAIRVLGLRSDRIPTPNRLVGVHVDRIDRADFFAWAQPGILRLDLSSIPELIPIHLQTRVEDRSLSRHTPLFARAGPDSYLQYGDDEDSREVRALVVSWIAGVPAGWAQVERIVERIRTGHRLDPEYRLPEGCRHAVGEFLLRARRGPDHLFASATVWALRSAGYPARLVAGLYARPERFDRRAGHTEVLAGDVHVWAELAVATDHHVTLEPTPGYEVLGPRRSLATRVGGLVRTLAALAAGHPLQTALLAAGVVAVVALRRRLSDFGDDLIGRLRPAAEGRDAVVRLVSRIDRRCRRAGVARPGHVPPPRWLAEIARRGGIALAPAALVAVEEALYAPAGRTIAPATARALERLATRAWSWERVRQAARERR